MTRAARSRVTLAALVALVALCARGRAAEPPIQPDARARFRAGVALLSDPDGARVEEAFRLFKEAYALSPSWQILGNLGAAAMRLERHGDAIDALSRYLAEGGAALDAAERARVERDLATLRAASATLSIDVPAGDGALSLDDVRARADGGRVTNTYALPRGGVVRLTVALGRHRLTTKLDGRDAIWEGEVGTSGAAVQLAVAPSTERATPAGSAAPAPARDGTARAVGLVAVSVGGAMLAAGVVTAIVGQRKQIALDDACPDKTCPERRRGDVDALRGWATATNALLIGGALVAAGGVTTLALDSRRATTLTWTPTSLALRRSF